MCRTIIFSISNRISRNSSELSAWGCCSHVASQPVFAAISCVIYACGCDGVMVNESFMAGLFSLGASFAVGDYFLISPDKSHALASKHISR
jgi:hypothetical protein